jgi:hypothetical protein
LSEIIIGNVLRVNEQLTSFMKSKHTIIQFMHNILLLISSDEEQLRWRDGLLHS